MLVNVNHIGDLISHVVNCHTASFIESLIVEACLANFKQMPFVAVELLIDVNDVETLVLYECEK